MINNQSKIIQIFAPGPMAGAEKVVLSGSKALQSKGLNCPIWVIKETRAPKAADEFILEAISMGIEVKEFICSSKFDISLIKQLKKELKNTSPDIIHAHGFKAALFSKMACPKATKYILTHHGVTSHTLQVKIYESIERFVMKHSDQVIAVSAQIKKTLIDYGIEASKISHINNLLSFEPSPRVLPKNNKTQLIYVGRLSPEKGCHILLEAMSKLDKNDVHLSILGDGIERQRLENIANELKLTDVVTFLGFQKDVKSHMIKADALIMPSLTEGLPMTLIEACCMGLPVLASKVGAIPDLIKSGENGILFESNNSLEITEALNLFEKNKDKLLNKSLDKTDFYIDSFGPEGWAKDMMDLYNRVLSQE